MHFCTQQDLVFSGEDISVDLNLFPNDLVFQLFMELGRTQRDDRGMLEVVFERDDTARSYGATIDQSSDPPFTFTRENVPVTSPTTTPDGENSIMFTNITPGRVTVTPMANAAHCSSAAGTWSFNVEAGCNMRVLLHCPQP